MDAPAAEDRVGDAEPLARYIVASKHLDRSDPANPKLKAAAFLPHPHVALSVFRVEGWTEEKRRAVGDDVAAQREAKERQRVLAKGELYPDDKRTFRLHGWGLTSAAKVRVARLDVVAKEPPPRHADIVGWPALTGDKKADEAAQMRYALELMKTQPQFVPAGLGGAGVA